MQQPTPNRTLSVSRDIADEQFVLYVWIIFITYLYIHNYNQKFLSFLQINSVFPFPFFIVPFSPRFFLLIKLEKHIQGSKFVCKIQGRCQQFRDAFFVSLFPSPSRPTFDQLQVRVNTTMQIYTSKSKQVRKCLKKSL